MNRLKPTLLNREAAEAAKAKWNEKSQSTASCITSEEQVHKSAGMFMRRKGKILRRKRQLFGPDATNAESTRVPQSKLVVRNSMQAPDPSFTARGKKLGRGLFMPRNVGGWTEDLVLQGPDVLHLSNATIKASP